MNFPEVIRRAAVAVLLLHACVTVQAQEDAPPGNDRSPVAARQFMVAAALAQAVQGERWPGAVAQQTLASGTVSSLDAHRDKN